MTGSTPVRTEDRDPSPTEVRKVPGIGRADSSEEVEPWDERRAPKKKTNSGVFGLMEGAGEMVTDNLNCFVKADEDGLEDGDLPSLSRPTSRSRGAQRSERDDDSSPSQLGMSRNKSTTRPLSPPSEAGGMTVEERRLNAIRNRESPGTTEKRAAFFKQLDPPTPSDGDRTFDEEGPDDEAAARRFRQPRARDDIDAPPREDEVEEYESYGDIRHDNSGDDVNCFDYTLNTISQMCGYGEDPSAKPREQKWSKPHDDSWIDIDAKEGDISRENETSVEQTAIEVEYVAIDEAPAKESPPSKSSWRKSKSEKKEKGKEGKWDTSRKNAYLAAMARKAKEDFAETTANESERPESPGDGTWPGTLPPEDSSEADNRAVEDVYSSFSPMERRKFLKLINSGMSSKDASSKILAERGDGEKKKKKSLSFKKIFKRGKSEKGSPKTPQTEKSATSPSTLVVHADTSQESIEVSTPERGYGGDSPGSSFEGISAGPSGTPPPSPASGVSPRSSESQDMSESPSTSMESSEYLPKTPQRGMEPEAVSPERGVAGSPATRSSSDAYRAYDMAVASSPLREAYDEDEGAVFVSSASESGDSDVDNRKRARTAAAVGATVALAAGATAAVVATNSGTDSEAGSSVPFEKSGNSYYDAVRKEVPEEDEDEQEEYKTYPKRRTPKGSRMASIRASPRSLGFVSLKDKKKKQLESENDEQGQSESRAVEGESWEAPERSPKRRLLGIPLSGKGFTALEDQQSGSLSKNTMSEDIEDEMRKLEAEFDASNKKDEAEGDDDLDQIERDLLRPGPVSAVEDLLEDGDDDNNNGSFALKTPRAMAESEADPNKRIDVGEDLSLDNYFDSTASYSSPVQPTQDQASVVSGKSEWTARSGYTGASTVHTQSSRKRHKGAAKKRLAKAKAAEKAVESKKQGWHESIVAAAASTNRVWDPQKGWVDYEDPDAATHEVKSTEKMRLNLNGVAGRADRGEDRATDDGSNARSADVPFPPEWDQQRKEMVPGEESPSRDREVHLGDVSSEGVALQSEPDEDAHEEMDADYGDNIALVEASLKRTPARSRRTPKGVDRATDTDSGNNVGWVASMRKATAGMEKDGQKWDPESGWVGVEKDVIESPQERSQVAPDGNEVLQTEGDRTQRGMPPTSPQSGPANRDALETFIEKSATPSTRRSELSTVDSDQAVASGGGAAGKKGTAASVGSYVSEKDQSSASVSTSKGSAQPNKYVQLGDNGSVRSAYAQEQQRKSQMSLAAKAVDGSRDLQLESEDNDNSFFVGAPVFARNEEGEEDTAPLLHTDKDDAYGTDIRKAPQVNVVKEKCDEDDLNLFSEDSFQSAGNVSSNEIRTPPRKDRSGPVDLDELDDNIETTDSEDTDDAAKASDWSKRQKVAALPTVPATPPTPSEMSSNAAKSRKQSTPVPRLGRNKRDTSPVNEGKAEVSSGTKGAKSTSSDSNKRSSNRGLDSAISPGGDETASATSSVKERLQQWESMSARKLGSRPDPPATDDSKGEPRGDHARSITPEALEWPGESDEASQPEEGQDVPAEWKSFFGKKVRAESSAAMQAQSRREAGPEFVAADDTEEYLRPEDGAFPTSRRTRALPQDKDDDDSLFRFDEGRQEVRRGSRNAPDNFPDISPIHSREEDEVVMEEIESNTGAVDKNSTFLQRLSTCAAPMLPSQLTKSCDPGGTTPSAHLAFLRNNNGSATQESGNSSAKLSPAALCGRPDVVLEETEDDSKSPSSKSSRTSKGRRGTSSIGSEVRATSSVASEDFGQKTAYLEAIAMKAAVSNPKRSGSSGRRRSPGSDISTSSRSEKWKAFLEKKKAASGESVSGSNTDVSKAAEKYAAEKVEEMISVMSSRSKSAPRSSRDDDESQNDPVSPNASVSSRGPYEMKKVRSDGDRPLSTGRAARKSESAKAAEELAAARVEAMMAAMSSKTLDEGEI